MKNRNLGIELLRIISMIMVLILHYLMFTGILYNHNYFSSGSFVIWLAESFCFVAVNCYVLISGYFLCEQKFKISKLVKIYFQVFFYSISIFLISLLVLKNSFNLKEIFQNCFPVIFGNYWFVSCYMMLYILSPFLNTFIKSLNKDKYKTLLIILIIVNCIISIFVNQQNNINWGGSYSIGWFVSLYLVSGYLRKFGSEIKNNKKRWLIIYVICSLLNCIVKFILLKLNIIIIDTGLLYNYYSITMLIGAIALFMFFKDIKVKNSMIKKFITFFAPCTFGVYLIHENPIVRELLWNSFKFIMNYKTIIIIISLGIIPLTLFVIFSIIDKIREIIFKLISYKKIDNNKSVKKFEDVVNSEN